MQTIVDILINYREMDDDVMPYLCQGIKDYGLNKLKEIE